MACLDTNALLDASSKKGRYREAARAIIAELTQSGEMLCTTRFNVAELFVGVERSDDASRESARVAEALDRIVILEFEDYIRFFPESDLASNARFYIGEINYAEKKYA